MRAPRLLTGKSRDACQQKQSFDNCAATASRAGKQELSVVASRYACADMVVTMYDSLSTLMSAPVSPSVHAAITPQKSRPMVESGVTWSVAPTGGVRRDGSRWLVGHCWSVMVVCGHKMKRTLSVATLGTARCSPFPAAVPTRIGWRRHTAIPSPCSIPGKRANTLHVI